MTISRAWRIAALASALLLPGTAAFAAPADFRTASLPAAGGAMKVGGMLVRLEEFLEMRDGRVQAQMSFHNLDDSAPASLALNRENSDAIANMITQVRNPKGVLRLRNAQGAEYRLIEISRLGDVQPNSDWISVEAGGSAFLTATFDPNGATRGAQPFALSVPVRMQWRPSDAGADRTSVFQINFGGLHRATEEARRPTAITPVPVSLLPAPSLPASTPPAAATGHFDDDLAPLIARLPAARPDSHRYLLAVGVEQYDDAPSVPFAERTTRSMSDLLRKRYGIPQENVTVITGADATGMKILGRLNSLVQRLTAGDTVYFYYTGHGLTARDGNNVYVVPKDAVPGAYEVEMLSLNALLRRFENSNAARVVAFLDTCFSGRISQRESLFPGAAPLVPTQIPATPAGVTGKTTLFLAGQSFQLANDYPEHGYRLFSYFLMRGLLDGKDDATRLEAYVAGEVRRISARRGAEYVQEPQLTGAALQLASPNMAGTRRLH
ncbi:MAG: caspase family protein [Rhodospirillaceae bacterium]